MLQNERIRDRIEIAVAGVVSLLFGASFGWNFGVDNQVVYMISSLRLLHPDILAKDWFVSQTTHYHPTFKYLAAALMALNSNGWAVGIAQTLVISAGIIALYFLIRELVDRRHALPGYLLLITVASITRTRGPCVTYVFDWILQPSTLGSAAFLASIPLFVRGQWLASGIALALSGLFHANYLILFFGSYTLAHLLLGKQDLKARIFRQLGPPLAVLLLFMPMILATALSKDAKTAQEIYTTIRSPHHFVIAGHERDFFSLVGLTLLSLGASAPLMRKPKSATTRLGILIASLLTVIWTGIVFSALLHLRPATQLFAWRLVPHTELVLTTLICAMAARTLLDPSAGRCYGILQWLLIISGLGTISLWASFGDNKRLPTLFASTILLIVLIRLAPKLGRRWIPEAVQERLSVRWRSGGVVLASALGLLLVYSILGPELRRFYKNSNVFSGLSTQERELYAWMRENTPKDAIFLTPPNQENMRFHGQRAIVVDWKSCPIAPAELLEWWKRIQDVVGQPMRGQRDLGGYASLDESRVQKLLERYGVDYAVVGRGAERSLAKFKVVYSNNAFSVLDLHP